jgi:16S rRNA (uracil1498-N3)-methyltransferase
MSDPVFVTSTAALAADAVVIDGDEGRHAAAVKRLRVGESVTVTDGVGLLVRGRIREVRERSFVLVDVLERIEVPVAVPALTVVQALPKGERAERAVALMTEVGVDVIVPWQAARCVVRWDGDRGRRAAERWAVAAREAGKQARRARFLEIAEAATTADVVALIERAGAALVLHEEAHEALPSTVPDGTQDIVLIVGPEGGIAPEEFDVFIAAGGRPVRLGPSIQRTSTAGASAASVLLAGTGRWVLPHA